MKLFVLALALIAAVSANHLINKRLTTLVQEGYSVDNVVNLLIALARVTGDNLQTLLDNWAQAESELISNIQTLEDLLSTQEQRCSEIDTTVGQLIGEIDKYNRYIRNAQRAIRTNLETLADRREKRCTANLIFVQKLKDNQDSSKLLSYLRDRIGDPSFQDYLLANGESLAELHHSVKNNKRSTLSLLAKHHMINMMQQYTGEDNLGYDTEARTDVGTGHVDNDRGEIHLDSYTVDTRNLDNFVSELLGYIDDLVSQLSHERHALQAAEFQAVEDLIDYQSSIDHQNMVLSTYIELWTVHVAETHETLSQNEAESASCHERASLLADQLEQAESDYEEKEEAFSTTRRSLEGTLAALAEVTELYVRKVVNAPAVYLEKIDEELSRAEPVEPEPVEPLTAEEKAEVVEDFENEERAEEARQEQGQAEERQEAREEAAVEREAEAIEQNIEEREEERLEEAQQEAEPVIQELSATELADEESALADQAAAAASELEELASETDGRASFEYFSDDSGNQFFYGAVGGLTWEEEEPEDESFPSDVSEARSALSAADEIVASYEERADEYSAPEAESVVVSEESAAWESEESVVYESEESESVAAWEASEESEESAPAWEPESVSVEEESEESAAAWEAPEESEESAPAWEPESVSVEEESEESVPAWEASEESEESAPAWEAESVSEESVVVSEESEESAAWEPEYVSEESVEEESSESVAAWEASEESEESAPAWEPEYVSEESVAVSEESEESLDAWEFENISEESSESEEEFVVSEESEESFAWSGEESN